MRIEARHIPGIEDPGSQPAWPYSGSAGTNQFVTDYTVCPTRVSDAALWRPTLERHHQLFGRPPVLAVADESFGGQANERLAYPHGVRHVALPVGADNLVLTGFVERSAGAPAVRAGSAPSNVAMGWRYRGLEGMQRWVGLGVIANNLHVLGRAGPPRALTTTR